MDQWAAANLMIERAKTRTARDVGHATSRRARSARGDEEELFRRHHRSLVRAVAHVVNAPRISSRMRARSPGSRSYGYSRIGRLPCSAGCEPSPYIRHTGCPVRIGARRGSRIWRGDGGWEDLLGGGDAAGDGR